MSPFQADISVIEKDPGHIDPNAESAYKVEGVMEPFYLLMPSRECVGIRDSVRDMRLPLNQWLGEWDMLSPEVMDQIEEAVPEIGEEPDQDDENPFSNLSHGDGSSGDEEDDQDPFMGLE